MTFSTPQYGQGGSYSAAQDRATIKAHAYTNGVRNLLAPSGGVMQGDLKVASSGGANGSVTIDVGDCFIDDGTGYGSYYSRNDALVTVGPFAANTGAPRTDIVYVQITDAGTPGVPPTITAGIGNNSTSVPAKAIGLATVVIPTGFTTTSTIVPGNITDIRQKAQAFTFGVTSTAAVASTSPGTLAYDISADRLKTVNNAGSWINLLTSGSISISDLTSGYSLNYVAGSAPSSPVDGQSWADTSNKRLMTYRSSDTTWQRTGHWASTGRTGCILRYTGSTAVGNANSLTVTWNVEDYDSDGFIIAPSTTVTIPAGLDGVYAVSLSVRFDRTTPASFGASIRISTGGFIYGVHGSPLAANDSIDGGSYQSSGTSVTLPLAAGDTLQFRAVNGSGGTYNLVGARATVMRLAV